MVNSIDRKAVTELMKGYYFYIPSYQRGYRWTSIQVVQLLSDLLCYASSTFNKRIQGINEGEYYCLQPVVARKITDKEVLRKFLPKDAKKDAEAWEIIDGQQRLTTLMLLLRAFYVRFESMKTEESMKTKELISRCLWKTDEFGTANLNELKIDSEVATDIAKEEFLDILKTGIVKDTQKSKYANNYRFFQTKIEEFLNEYLDVFSYLPIRILNNCILLPIEADNQNTALRIFSTLNDRGLPLSDADIFKAQFYKYYSDKGQKQKFIDIWKELEELSEKIFNPISGTPMDELFTRYMYYERAKMGIKSSTT